MALSLDYRSFSSDGPSKQVFNREWWKEARENMPEAIAHTVHTLQEGQVGLDAQRSICVRLYGNSPLYGVNGMNYSKLPSMQPAIRDRITYNVVQSVIDTVTAKIAKNKPKPLFLTERGDYKLRRKAQKLNQFMDGVFFSNRMRELGPRIFRDACVMGTGIVHIFGDGGQVKYEPVKVGELLVDEQEAMFGDPRQLHRVKNIDRQVLISAFPGKKQIIVDTNEATDPSAAGRPHVSDLITVAESWHLPSGREAKDGLHTIICDGGVLYQEQWEHDFFPFAFLHWSKRLYGFWGQGLAEQLQNIQLEINKLLWVIQHSMHRMGTAKIWLEQGNKVPVEKLNNDFVSVGTYTGQPPIYVAPPMVQPEVYQHLSTLIQRAYEQAGISMLSAAAQKPAGLDSGRALREYNDIETDRFMVVGQAYEQFHLDCAKVSVAMARDQSEKGEKLSVKAPGSKFLQSINWKDVDMEEDKYVLQAFPVSSLPNEPSGRLATIQEYIQAGFIDPNQGRRLMDFPDLDQIETLANAVEERILASLDKIVDEGVYTPPDQYMEPNMARKLSLQYINEYQNQGLEEERLQMLREFNSQISEIEAMAAQPAMAQAPMPEVPGVAAPGTQALSPGLTLPPPMPPQPLV